MRWAIAVLVVALLAVGGIALAARGGNEDQKPEGSNLSRVMCPLELVDPEASEPEYKPAKNAFDTAELIDKPLADARSIAARHGCEVVVSLQDGKGTPVPIDFDPKRIYVYTENEIVTQIEGVGGGL
jgi:hypothetical protein